VSVTDTTNDNHPVSDFAIIVLKTVPNAPKDTISHSTLVSTPVIPVDPRYTGDCPYGVPSP